MKIKIEHLSNTFNYGSCMMGITLINKIINEIGERSEIYIDASSEEDLERIRQEVNYNKIFRDKNSYDIYGKNKIDKLKNYNNNINKNIEKFDSIIIIGGDDISEYYGNQSLMLELYKINKYCKQIPVFLVGQTLGPFTGIRKNIASYVLKKANLYTRDDNCLSYIKNLGVTTAIKGRDLAFLELPNNKNELKILEKYNLKDEKYITIVPSGLWQSYTRERSNYINTQIDIIKSVLDNKKMVGVKIVLLPHVILPKHVDDRIIINEIVENLNQSYTDRIIEIKDIMLPSEAREILGNGLFTITGRMHAAVSTFYMRKPALSLSYSVKYAGVIGSGLNMGELIIEAANDHSWTNREIIEQINKKVCYIIDNYDELIEKIDLKVSETSEIAINELNDLIERLQNI